MIFRVEVTLVCGKYEVGTQCVLEAARSDFVYQVMLRKKSTKKEREEALQRVRFFLELLHNSPGKAQPTLDMHSMCPDYHALWDYKLVEGMRDTYGSGHLYNPTTIEEWSYGLEHPLAAELAEATSQLKGLAGLQGPAVDIASKRLRQFITECYRLRLRQAVDNDTAALAAWLPVMKDTIGRAGELLLAVEDAVRQVYDDPAALAERLTEELSLTRSALTTGSGH